MFEIISIGEHLTCHISVGENKASDEMGMDYGLIDNSINGDANTTTSAITDIFVTAKEPTKAVLFNSVNKEIIRKIDLKYDIISLLAVTNTIKAGQFIAVCRQNLDIIVLGVKVGNSVKKTILAKVVAENIDEKSASKLNVYAKTCVSSQWGQFLGTDALVSAEATTIVYAGFYKEAPCESLSGRFSNTPYQMDGRDTINGKAAIFLKNINLAFGACSLENLPGMLTPYEGDVEESISPYMVTGLGFKKFSSYRGVVAGLFNNDRIVFFNRQPYSLFSGFKTVNFQGSDITAFCFNRDKLITVVNHTEVYIYDNFHTFYAEKCKAAIASEISVNPVLSEPEEFKVYGSKETASIDLNDRSVELPMPSFALEIENIKDVIYDIRCFNNGAHTIIIFAVKDENNGHSLYGVRDGIRLFKYTFKDEIADINYNVTKVSRGPARRASFTSSGQPTPPYSFVLSELVSVVLRNLTDSIFKFKLTNESNGSNLVRDMRPGACESGQLHSQMARSLDI